MSDYRFQPPTRTLSVSALLPVGDYPFLVVSCDPPYVNPKSGNYVCAVELSIQPDGQKVFANPWAHPEGTVDKNGVRRDDIAIFLTAINRAPKPGEEPSWQGCVGAKGKARLKIEDDQNGVPRNKVAFFHTPKQAAASPSHQTTVSQSEFEKARSQAVTNAVGDPDLDVAPDDIPFKTTIYKDVRKNRLNRRIF